MKKLMIILAAVFFLCTPVMAADLDLGEIEEAVPQQARELMEGISAGSADADGLVSRIVSYISDKLSGVLAQAIRPAMGVVAVVLLCSVAEPLMPGEGFDYVRLCACLAAAAISVEDVSSLVSEGQAVVSTLCDYSHVLLPTMCSLAAVGGAVSSAGAKYAVSALFSDILLTVSQNLVIPLICGYVACVTASAAISDGRLGAAVKLIKWACKTALTALAGVFTAWLGIVGLSTSAADAAAVKVTKTVISNFLPVVGKLIADASDSLVAGAGVLRGAAGVFGLGVTVAVCILPFLRLAVRYALFKAAAAVASAAAGSRLSGLIDGIASAYGMILGLVGTAAAIMFVSILSFVKAVT